MTVVPAVTSLVEEMLHIVVPGPDVDLLEAGLLDSLGVVELWVALEERCGFLPVESFTIDRFRSVRSIAAFLEEVGAADAMAEDHPALRSA